MTNHQSAYFPNLISMVIDNHVQAIRYMRTLDMTAGELLCAVCAAACAYARMLQDDPVRRAEFYKEAFPEGWQRFHAKKLLLHVFMYIKRAKKKGANYNVASAHSVALQGVCDNRDIADKDIAAYIKERGGINGLLKESEAENVAEDVEDLPIDDEVDDTAPKILRRQKKSASIFDGDDEMLSEPEEAAEPDDDEDDEEVHRPERKRDKAAKSELKLLPRQYIVGCILVRPQNEPERQEILEAFREGKKVLATLVPREASETHELYEGAGGFIGVTIEDYDVA